MFQLSLAAPKTAGNFSEGMSPAQLTKEHGHKLTPTGKSSSMTLGLGLFNGLLELDSRKQL
jgi:hypothetical protein